MASVATESPRADLSLLDDGSLYEVVNGQRVAKPPMEAS
jgi:hypothetical protein